MLESVGKWQMEMYCCITKQKPRC